MSVDRKSELTPIKHLVITPSIVTAIGTLHRRASVEHFHDLLILFGPENQKGSVRLITGSAIATNPFPNSPYYDIQGSGYRAREWYRSRHPEATDTAIIGVGTAIGVREDVPTILSVYEIYYAGGSQLLEQRLRRGDFSQGRFYVRESVEKFSVVEANNIHFLQT